MKGLSIYLFTLILSICESLDFKNLATQLCYDYTNSSDRSGINEFLVRKIDSKYGLYSDNALIQYLNSQLDDTITHEYHLINIKNIINQYNFTLNIESTINNKQLIDNFNTDNEIKELFDAYFIQEFIKFYKLERYLQNKEIQIKNSRNILIVIRLSFKETNIEVLNTRLKYLLLIIKTLFRKDGLSLFKLFQLTGENSITIKRVEFTSTVEDTFCMGINRLELERFIYPFDKLINTNLIIEKGNLLLRLNAYNRLLSISNTDGMIYQYKILFDESSFKIDNEVDIKLCHELPKGVDFEYNDVESDKIFIESIKILNCNLTRSDLYYINDRHVLIGLHLKDNVLHFTPYGQNGSFLSINCTSCQQISYRTYLVCLNKNESSLNKKSFFELNYEVTRFMKLVKNHEEISSSLLIQKSSFLIYFTFFLFIIIIY
jgi:hypothetical protein